MAAHAAIRSMEPRRRSNGKGVRTIGEEGPPSRGYAGVSGYSESIAEDE
jgi:hypothetical protein